MVMIKSLEKKRFITILLKMILPIYYIKKNGKNLFLA